MADTVRRARPTRASLHSALLTAAGTLLEHSGPESLQARAVAAAAGTSTQSLYTLFGGTPGLIEALVADGFLRLAAQVDACPLTEDPVADHFSRGWAYCDWALAHPQRYRLMFGMTGGALRPHTGLELTVGGSVANFAEGRAALDLLLQSVQRVIDAGRVRPAEALTVAGQFLSATHGAVLLQIAGAFGNSGDGLPILAEAGINLFIGLGDAPEAVRRSVDLAIAARRDRVSIS
jgi:AcrR family transcriptional regulator